MAKLFYQEKIQISKEMLNENGNLTNHAILHLFQDVAGVHAAQLKIDYIELNKRNLMWVVVRNRHQVFQSPKCGETVLVSTWPHPNKRLDFDREYRIESLHGDIYIQGDSKWCILDKIQKRMVMVKDLLPVDSKYVEKHNFSTPLLQINVKGTLNEKTWTFQVNKNQIDQNNHLNNTEYASMIDQCLKDLNVQASLFEINFVKETKLNQILEFKYYEDNENLYFEGYVEGNLHVKVKVICQ